MITKTIKIELFLVVIGVSVVLFWIAKTRYDLNHFQSRTPQEWLVEFRTDTGPVEDILKPKQVITGDEKKIITFEVPIASEKLGGHPEMQYTAELRLWVDDKSASLNFGESKSNALLYWNLQDEQPPSGLHQIQVEFLIGGRSGTPLLSARGPAISYVLSNRIPSMPIK